MSKSKADDFVQNFINATRQETDDILTDEQQRMIEIAESLPVEYFLTADGQTQLKREYPDIYRAFTDKVRSSTRAKNLETDVAY